jgi:ABC-type transport system involved in cytochrome bd biosynthesis fused ATPase/permease subunit
MILLSTDKYLATGVLSLQDLAALQAGDETELGERGINLSGEDSQRITTRLLLFQTEWSQWITTASMHQS